MASSTTRVPGLPLKDPRTPDRLMMHMDLPYPVSTCRQQYFSVMSNLCAPVFPSLFARRSEPVHTRRSVTDARPIPRLWEDVCGWKANSVMSICTRKIPTVCLQNRSVARGGFGLRFQAFSEAYWFCVTEAWLAVCEYGMNVLRCLEFPPKIKRTPFSDDCF